jgi:hypothetical protein
VLCNHALKMELLELPLSFDRGKKGKVNLGLMALRWCLEFSCGR